MKLIIHDERFVYTYMFEWNAFDKHLLLVSNANTFLEGELKFLLEEGQKYGYIN